MSDEEYREWLWALARKHLQLGRGEEGPAYLGDLVERLSSVARFANAVGDRADNPTLVHQLAKELRDAAVHKVTTRLEDTGVLAALDELPEVTFGQLRRSVIPDEDVRLLSRSGVSDPETDVTIVIHHARQRLSRADARPSEIAIRAQQEFNRAVGQLDTLTDFSPKRRGKLDTLDESSPKKKRKILNGIGKVLAGAITGAGNLLLASGTVVAPNPATGYAVIGSSALAVGYFFQGLGDLRGE
jgi:hypothetical protein